MYWLKMGGQSCKVWIDKSGVGMHGQGDVRQTGCGHSASVITRHGERRRTMDPVPVYDTGMLVTSMAEGGVWDGSWWLRVLRVAGSNG